MLYNKKITIYSYESPHDKTNKMTVRPAKTQISLGIRPVWSESSLCAQWVAKDPSFLHADSEDSVQTGWMPRLIWVFAGRTGYFVGFVMRRLIYTTSTGLKYYKILYEIVELIKGLLLARSKAKLRVHVVCFIEKKLEMYDKNQFEVNYSHRFTSFLFIVYGILM